VTIDAIKKHLDLFPLYVVERTRTRRDLPNVMSFYIVVDGKPLRIDKEIILAINRYHPDDEPVKPFWVGTIDAVQIHDPYIKTLAGHMEDISEALFGDPAKLVWRVI
jgi:hypothetical protein